MAQNILLVATALGLDARPIAGFDDEKVLSLLDIDPNLEQPVYMISLGGGMTHDKHY
jgi:nitroreductase